MGVRVLLASVRLTPTEARTSGSKIMTSTDTTDGDSLQTTVMPFGYMPSAMTQRPLTVMTDMNGKLFEGTPPLTPMAPISLRPTISGARRSRRPVSSGQRRSRP
jgi:hypothetical protein